MADGCSMHTTEAVSYTHLFQGSCTALEGRSHRTGTASGNSRGWCGKGLSLIHISTLNILAKKKAGVTVIIYTFPGTKITKKDIDAFNAQYPMLTVEHTTVFHDRFLILDSRTGYHIGASLKDAGQTCFGINKIEDEKVISELLLSLIHIFKLQGILQ